MTWSRMRIATLAPLGAAAVVVFQTAQGMALCPGCGEHAAVLRGRLMCLVCGCQHVPDRSVASAGPYHDGIAWERCESRLRKGGHA